jgi:hypothetical protein
MEVPASKGWETAFRLVISISKVIEYDILASRPASMVPSICEVSNTPHQQNIAPNRGETIADESPDILGRRSVGRLPE